MSARGLEADFKPATTIETELVERLAGLLWRLRRVPVFEAALMQARFYVFVFPRRKKAD
jgi:hypothetical protein